jgi:prolyl-tRNA synthetase
MLIIRKLSMEKVFLRSREEVEHFLTSLSIPFTTTEHVEIKTVKEGLDVCGSLDGAFLKNLYIKDKKDNYYLLSALHNTETPYKTLGKILGVGASGVRAAPAPKLQEHLQVMAGAVNPFALANDHGSVVKFLLDKAVLGVEKVIVHPMVNTASTAISSQDLLKFLQNIGKEAQVIDFTEEGKEEENPSKGEKSEKGNKGEKGKGKKEEEVKKEEHEHNMLGVTIEKEKDFSGWYSEVITKGGLIEYYDVSGCYILRPWAYAIWEEVQKKFDHDIKLLGVKNSYFPMFVSEKALSTEKSHIEGFAPEVAWVTKSGTSDLEIPIAIRPTSETIMYPAFAKWIRSHRDLPLKLNQWCNVVRWEFKHPTPFLRTREFLWQEGHTAYSTLEQAAVEVRQILDLYAQVYEDLLAVPVIKGQKSELEKFAGGHYTTTIESFIPTNGRGIQCATSHCLGQNFSKMFEIWFEDEKGKRQYAWQNSWGLTTRSIGVMVMWHSDNKGLILPPRVAATQVIVIPIPSKKETDQVLKKSQEIVSSLKALSIRADIDERDNYHPGWKFNHWELMGVPLRLEFGPKDLQSNSCKIVARFNKKVTILNLSELDKIPAMLEEIQAEMFYNAKNLMQSRVIKVDLWQDFLVALNGKNLVLTPWCEQNACEEAVKKRSAEESKHDDGEHYTGAAKTLCIPFEQDLIAEGTKCFNCGVNATKRVLWGRSY